jgi:hypothetical protein
VKTVDAVASATGVAGPTLGGTATGAAPTGFAVVASGFDRISEDTR